jgi:hypothetical protein
MFAINEAYKPSRIGSLAMFSGVLLGSAGVAGPALSADLPYDNTAYRPGYYRNYNSGCYRCGRQAAPVAERPPVEERVAVPVVEQVAVAERHWVQRDYIERQYPYYATVRYAYSAYPAHTAYSSYSTGPAHSAYSSYSAGPAYSGYSSYQAYPGQYRYSYYYPAPGADAGPDAGPGADSGPSAEPYPAYGPPPGRPRRQGNYGTFQYPPAVAAYEHEAEPRAPEPRVPYRYEASGRPHEYRPAYEYDYYKPSPAHEYRPAYEYGTPPRPPARVPGGHHGPGYSR